MGVLYMCWCSYQQSPEDTMELELLVLVKPPKMGAGNWTGAGAAYALDNQAISLP